jgi:hypothetical protein
MLVRRVRMILAMLFLALGYSSVLGQQVPAQPVRPAVQPPPTAPAQPPARPGVPAAPTAPAATTYRAKQVLGSKVAIQGNVSIGSVEDIVFDDAGNLEYLIVANEGKLVTVPWEAAKFNFDQRIATVNLSADQYKSIPTYTTTTYPEFYAPAYRTQVYKYYGLAPRDLRRLERRGVIP